MVRAILLKFPTFRSSFDVVSSNEFIRNYEIALTHLSLWILPRVESRQEVIQGRVHSNTYRINPDDEEGEEEWVACDDIGAAALITLKLVVGYEFATFRRRMALPYTFLIFHIRTRETSNVLSNELEEEKYARWKRKILISTIPRRMRYLRKKKKEILTVPFRKKSERKYNFLLPWWSLEGSTSQSAVLEPVPAGSSLYHICYAKYSENKEKREILKNIHL